MVKEDDAEKVESKLEKDSE